MAPRQPELFPFGTTLPAYQPRQPALRASDPLAAAIPPFAAYMADREFAVNTIKSFLNDLALALEFLDEKRPLQECTPELLQGLVHYLKGGREAPCSPKSLERRITTLKVFFGWLAASGVLAEDPAATLIHRPVTSPLPVVLGDQQVEALLETTRSMRDAGEAPDARPHLLISLLLSTAMKKSECMRIALQHIDLSDPAQPSVFIRYEKPRQRAKSRRLRLPDDWPQTLPIYLRRYQPKTNLFECTARNLEYVLHNVSIVAGLPHNLTFEMLRWTSAKRSIETGMAPEQLRVKLGLARITWDDTSEVLEKLLQRPL
ncbi:MAG: tyrosine-type recombinase/integrase [Anaerolineae bacterium]